MFHKRLKVGSIALGILMLAALVAVVVAEDTTPPTLESTYPVDGDDGVPTDESISFTFSEPVVYSDTDPSMSISITIMGEPAPVEYDWWMLNPSTLVIGDSAGSAWLAEGTPYVVRISGIKDAAGNAMVEHCSTSFMTFGDQPPVASFTATPTSGLAPLTVTFNPADSWDYWYIVSYEWDWGDGSPHERDEYAPADGSPWDWSVMASHTYTVPGTYLVTLTVTDDMGATDTATTTISVLTPAQSISDLITQVENYDLPADIERGLTDKLDAAILALDRGSDGAAVNQLYAFIGQVKALQKAQKLTAAQAAALIAEAQEIIDHI